MTINEIYKKNCKDEEYWVVLQAINKIISKKSIVLEFGTGEWMVSSAILDGMWRYSKLISFDILWSKYVATELKEAAKNDKKYFSYRPWHSREVIVTDIDILVIDTVHNANYLWAELYNQAVNANKYIVVVGTGKYGDVGEEEWHLGLTHCINKFINDIWGWKIKKVVTEWIGCTILERIKGK